MPDAVELDLSSAHFAIAAKDWGLPDLYDFLSTGQSLWMPLLEHVGLPPELRFKKVVKSGSYGVVYGAGERRIISDMQAEHEALTGSQMPAEQASRLLTHPLIRETLEGRTRELESIREAIRDRGYVLDCFGKQISRGKNGFGHANERDFSRSILAQLNQARELRLMEPLLELAEAESRKARPNWRIVLWQHDGVSIRATRRTEKVIEQIQLICRLRRTDDYPTHLHG
ncbi:hypothetical protein BSZ36_07590 [Rubricoccus marinus]|uniref:DNA-directed DNA polymerase family A palm domain-containing protein n=2 Tax=Rubricoccus marinus TaxID=716817 RepID=A0A259TYS8_9BACT|nr:hypothetical protein BSZ36_07590 [Rubricoccus marinus]